MHRFVRAALFFACAIAFASTPVSAEHDRKVGAIYRVILDAPHTQVVRVEVTFPAVGRDTMDVVLPTWRPGRYVILDPAGTIRTITATVNGEPADKVKVSKSRWRIDLPAGTSADSPADVTVAYDLYANSINDRTRHVDDTHAFLSGSSVFVYHPERRDELCVVEVDAPDGWRVATGLTATDRSANPMRFEAATYDVLVDSPLEIGEHQTHVFEVNGVPHEIVIWDAGWDGEYDFAQLADDFAAIARVQIDMFGSIPYERYVFLVHVAPGLGGGTEHLNSTIMQTRPSSFEDMLDDDGERSDAYRRFLGLVSHELYHTWNVKAFRPEGIARYDYTGENYTPLLWLVEGTTSYYDDLCLVRAGLMSEKQYLDRLSGSIDSYMNRPGRRLQSLSQSSFDAWIKFNRPSPDAANATVSFYSKGALVSMLLDARIRELTGGTRSLDDLMRLLYERYPLSRGFGFTSVDVKRIAIELVGRINADEIMTFFDRYIDGVDDPDWSRLSVLGLDVTFEHESDEDSEADSGDAADEAPEAEPYLGLRFASADGGVRVRSVFADGPAGPAGVLVDDVIVAIDGRRVTSPGDVDSRVDRLDPGDALSFTLFRRDVLRTVRVELGGRLAGEWSVEKSQANEAARRVWLHLPPEDDEEGTDDDEEDEG